MYTYTVMTTKRTFTAPKINPAGGWIAASGAPTTTKIPREYASHLKDPSSISSHLAEEDSPSLRLLLQK
jgi:hypothetical protein